MFESYANWRPLCNYSSGPRRAKVESSVTIEKEKAKTNPEAVTKPQPYSLPLIGHIVQESIMFFTGSLSTNTGLCGRGGGGGGYCVEVFH